MNGELYSNAYDGTHESELWQRDGTAAGTESVKGIQVGSGGAEPYLVKDINTNTSGNVGSYPRDPANMNGKMYFMFMANDGTHGSGLWRSDGTTAGTEMVVKGVQVGTGGFSSISMNDELYFSAYDETHGSELWRSDGTAAGTEMVKDINAGSNGSYPSKLTNVNGILYFMANDGTHGYELWRSDGTAAGTVLVKDIFAGSIGSRPSNLTDVNGTLYFSAYTETNGYELWRSDGTAAGTVLVKDIFAGNGSSYPWLDVLYLTGQGWINVNGVLYFQADDGTHGYELWRSDGTAAGTVLVKDIFAGSKGSYPYNLTNVNGTLYFKASDGTSR